MGGFNSFYIQQSRPARPSGVSSQEATAADQLAGSSFIAFDSAATFGELAV